jgi:glycosyltransferase involved in cell wall biosynthesis
LLAAVVLLFQHPGFSTAIELATAIPAPVAVVPPAASRALGAAAGADPALPMPPLLQLWREAMGKQQHMVEEEQQPGKAEGEDEAAASAVAAAATRAAAATAAAPSVPSPPFPLRHAIWWFGPIFSASGYGTEAIDFLLALARSPSSRNPTAAAHNSGPLRASHHGDALREDVVRALPAEDRADLLRLVDAPQQPDARLRPAVVVCHTFPTNVAGASAEWGRWRTAVEREATAKKIAAPLPPGEQCPPDPRTHAYDYVVIRTMYETDVPPAGAFVRKCNSANEVWVPTRWNVEAFVAGGIDRAKLRAVPEGVNTSYFDPGVARGGGGAAGVARRPVVPMDLGGGRLVFGRTRAERGDQKPFIFLSSFKWEPRKGWDVLLRAYLTEFLDGGGAQEDAPSSPSDVSRRPNVELHILTRPYAGNSDFAGQMRAWADASLVSLVPTGTEGQSQKQQDQHGDAKEDNDEEAAGRKQGGGSGSSSSHNEATAYVPPSSFVPAPYRRFPAVFVHTHHLADLPALYAAADAFVLPSRGEGWGRPHVEAMSMALPVLATNWSGPTAFLDEEVGYPIEIEGLEDAGGGLKWARPSAAHLRRMMRRVVERPEEAREKGLAARRRMVERYSPEVIARVLEAEFRRIEDAMP